MAGSRPWRATGVALLVFFSLLGVNEVSATSLQVAPTSLQLEARQRAGELWLTNSGTSPVKLQVRVFRWTPKPIYPSEVGSTRYCGSTSTCCARMRPCARATLAK